MMQISLKNLVVASALATGLAACAGASSDDASNGAAVRQPEPAPTATDGDDAGAPADTDAAADAGAPAEEFNFPPPAYWENGTTCGTKPTIQVHKYSDNFIVFRQSICTNFEAPFNFLFLGKARAMLLDTGTGHAPIREATDKAIADYTAAKGIDPAGYKLIVAHTHSHGDHVGGDRQFQGRPNTTMVGYQATQVAQAFGFTQWPQGESNLDLGDGARLDILPFPGHESAHIAVYDRETKLLFTGDTLYPGRLYIQSWPTFQASVHKLAGWVRDHAADRPVVKIMGNHIELRASRRPGDADYGTGYPMGTRQHLDEHVLPLDPSVLQKLDDAAQRLGTTARRDPHEHFIIYP